jgi:ribosomal-protein-alanine N-acetyltransferase
MSFSFTTFPTLKTERLTLRKADFKDIETVYELRSSEEINKFVGTKRIQNREEAKDFIVICDALYKEKKRVFWLIEFRNKILGSIVLHSISLKKKEAEIGYKLKPVSQGNGFMSEAIEAVLNFGFEKMNLETIEAFTHKNNKASIALLKKHHFILQPERKCENFEYNQIFKLTNNT